jgi:hypothetical protein
MISKNVSNKKSNKSLVESRTSSNQSLIMKVMSWIAWILKFTFILNTIFESQKSNKKISANFDSLKYNRKETKSLLILVLKCAAKTKCYMKKKFDRKVSSAGKGQILLKVSPDKKSSGVKKLVLLEPFKAYECEN